MPIYEYRCQECQQIFEQWQKDYSDQEKSCPVCGSQSQRMISNTSFVLKGSGWYVTDYCKKEGSSEGNGKKEQDTKAKPDTPVQESSTKTAETPTAAAPAKPATAASSSSSTE